MIKLHNLLKQVVNSKETNLNENKRHGVTRWLSIVCLLFFISMVACAPMTSSEDICLLFFMSMVTCSPTTSSDDSGGGGNDGGNQPVITLTYPSATFGTGETINPVEIPSQTTSYTLTHALGGTVTPTPPTINPNTGDITTTAITTAGVYSVTVYVNSGTQITTSSFRVTYIALDKAALEREVKEPTATGRAAWGNTGNFNYIDTSKVTDMVLLFYRDPTFNGNISNWDVSSVTDMQLMFNEASAFNQDLSSWDVSSVTSMQDMFQGASAFNQNLEAWEVTPSAIITQMFDDSGVTDRPTWCTTNRNC